MAYNTFIPMYINRTESKRSRSLVTAAEWNEILNLNITQGDHTEQGLYELVQYFFGEDGLTGHMSEIDTNISDLRLHDTVLDNNIQSIQDYLTNLKAQQVAVNTIAGYIGTNVQALLESITGTVNTQASAMNLLVKNIDIDENTGDLLITKQNGTTVVLPTNMEYIVQNYTYDAATESMILHYPDGSTVSISMSAFISEYDFENSESILFTVSNHKVTATLSPTYYNALMQAKTAAEAAAGNAQMYAGNASFSATAAATSATTAESYAHGGTGSRVGESSDNAQYYSQQASQQALAAAGSAASAEGFADNAEDFAGDANDSALESRAWANGTDASGNPVPSTHPAWHNNAKYFKDLAEEIAGGDFQPKITTLGLLKGTGNGNITPAVPGADYQPPLDFTSTPSASNKVVTEDNLPTVPTALSDLTDDSTHRTVTDTEKSTWNSKQNKIQIMGLLKGYYSSDYGLEAATPGVDYQPPLEFTSTPSQNNKVVCEDDVPSGGASLDNLAYVEEGTTATKAYVKGEYLVYDGKLYKTKTAIASGATFVVDTNIERTNVGDELIIANKTAHVVEIKSSGTWTVPDGVTEVDVFLVGAGQDGSAGGFDNKISVGGGTGGAGGKIVRIDGLKVVPNENIAVSIGTNGADTTFGALSSANGTSQAGAGPSLGITTVSVNQFCPWTNKLYGIGGACGGWAHTSSSDMSSNGDGWGVTVSFGENIAKSGGAKSTATKSSSSYYCNGGGGASASNNGGNAYVSLYADVTYGGNGGDGGANTGHGGGGGGGTVSTVNGNRTGVASVGGTGGSGIVIVHYYK